MSAPSPAPPPPEAARAVAPPRAGSLWLTRQALVPALAVALLTAVLLLFAQALLVDELGGRGLADAQHRADDLAHRLDAELRSAVREVQLLARAVRPGQAPEAVRAELDFLLPRSPSFIWLGLASLDGTVLAGTQGWLEGRSLATRPVFRGALQTGYVGDSHPAVMLAPLLAAGPRPVQDLLDIGEPVRDAQGRVAGVLAAHLGVDWIERLRRETAAGAVTPGSTLAAGVYVVTGDEGRSLVPGERLPDGVPATLARPAELRDAAGRRYLAAAATLARPGDAAPALLPWRVIVLLPREAVLAPAHQVMRTMALTGAAAALLVGVAGAWLARRLLLPWGPLFQAVAARGPGPLDATALALDVQRLARQIERERQDMPLSGPEAVLLRLAHDAADLRRMVDQLPVALMLVDENLGAQYLNPSFTRLLGWDNAAVRGRPATGWLLDADDRATFERQLGSAEAPVGEFAARMVAQGPDGRAVAVQCHCVPLLDAQGTVVGAMALLHDIRPELAARERADALAGRMRALADAALDELLCTLDGEGRVLEWNRGAERITGLAPGAALGRPLGQLLGSPEPLEALLVDARRAGRCTVLWRCAPAGGRTLRLEGSVYPLGTAPGTARFGVILRDLSEQHAVHHALQRSEAHMRLAVEAARIGTWEVEFDGTVPRMVWSEGYGATFGVPQSRLPSNFDEMSALVHADDHAAVRDAFGEATHDAHPLRLEFRLRGDAGWRWHALHGRALRGADGRVQRLIGVGLDITESKLAEAELRAGRERLERIVQTLSEGLVLLDAEGRCTLINRAAERIVGTPSDAILGRRYDEVPWRRLALDGSAHPLEHPHVRLQRGEPPILAERLALQPPGMPRRVISLNGQPVLDGAGRFEGSVLTFADITQAWQAERALADGQARLAAVVDGASDAIISVDLRGRISLFNPAAERIFGRPAAAMLGGPMTLLLPPEMQDGHEALLQRFAEAGSSRRQMGAGRVQGRHANGRLLELEASISKVRIGGELVLTAILRDITERVVHERALEQTRQELAQLNHRLLEQEKEGSQRLAQALHDELGQTLSALRLNFDAWRGAPPALGERLADRLGQLVVTANRQIRSVMRDLRPPLLDELGLEAALDNELQQHQPVGGRPRLALQVPARLFGRRWPADVEYAAFMVGREALLNALQHAQASEVVIELDGDELELLLQVRDDGLGIPDEVRAGRAGHLGLVGMRERARAIGAAIDWDVTTGRGTTVRLRWTAGSAPPA